MTMDITILEGLIIGLLSIVISSIIAFQSNAHPKSSLQSIHDIPQILMYLVGAWIFIPLGYIWVVAYVLIAIFTNVWYLATICPNCINFGKKTGISLLCGISRFFGRKGDLRNFQKQFKRNIGVVIIGWIAPLIGSFFLLYQTWGNNIGFGYNLLMIVSFCVIGFYILPKAYEPSCNRCAMKNKCPHKSHEM